jgi:hypothetical protein
MGGTRARRGTVRHADITVLATKVHREAACLAALTFSRSQICVDSTVQFFPEVT